MEREVGVGIGMGNTCKPMAFSFQCMKKSTTIKKKKRFLLLGRKAMTNLRSILKSKRHYFDNKGPSCGFSSSQYGCESWTVKKADR